jgi:predicted Zn-dependent peptidase
VNRLPLVLVLVLSVGVSAQQRANWPSERPPRALAAHEIKFPPYEMQTFANGLQVIAVPHHEQPVVSLRLIVRAGAAQDPENRPGVAAMAAALLDQGTKTKSAAQIASTIDSIGGALGTGSGPDMISITSIVMKDSLGLGLDLVADLAQHPAFAIEELERQRQQAISGMRVGYDDPEFLANAVFDRLVYGLHPYGRPQSGTPETVGALSRDDLVAFHRKWFGANNAILAIVGDVNADDAFAGAERAFGGWEKVDLPSPARVEPPVPTRRLIVVDKPGAVQTEIRVGNVGPPRKHADYTALDLASKILGGEGANRLHRVLRSERGLTYGASADFNALKESGELVAQTNTRSATTGETLRLIVDEMWRLLRDPVGDRELAGAQEYLPGSFPLTIETPSQIATHILNAVFFGLNLSDLQTFRERVNAVTAEDITRVARAYLHPDELTIVLVGDASAFVKQLPGAGFAKFDVIPASELDLLSPDLRRKAGSTGGAAYLPAADLQPPQRVTADAAKTLLDKAIAAKGGLGKLKAIRTVRADTTTTVRAQTGRVTFPSTTWIEYPDHFRVDADMPGGKLAQVYAEGRYWVEDASGVKEMPENGRAPMQSAIEHDVIRLLVKASAGELVVREIDSDDPLLGAIEVSGRGMSPLSLYINRDNGLIEKARYVGAEGRSEEVYSDYRNVNGVQFAFHTVLKRGALPEVERDVKTIHYNVPLAPGLFVRR